VHFGSVDHSTTRGQLQRAIFGQVKTRARLPNAARVATALRTGEFRSPVLIGPSASKGRDPEVGWAGQVYD